jgi:hypothetical protein
MKKIKASVFLSIGILVMIGIVIWFFNFENEFVKKSISTKAIVTNIAHGKYHPEIEIILTNGNKIAVPLNGLIKGYQIGDTLNVRYTIENNITTVYENSISGMYGFVILFLVLAMVFITISFYLFYQKNS